MGFGFASQVTYTVGFLPNSVTSADVNGDGKLDLVTANQANSNVSVLLGIGDGTFGVQTTYAVGVGLTPVSVISTDVNGDGKLDLVTTNIGSGHDVSVLLGLGNGAFGTPTTYDVAANSQGLTSADVNGDGKPDLIVTSGANMVSVLLGIGGGAFGSPTSNSVGSGSSPVSVQSADVNGDGKLDLITSNYDSHSVAVLLGNGDGTFGTQTSFAVGNRPASVIVADVDRDGKLDLITANQTDNNVSVLLGNGNGTFGAQTTYVVGSSPFSVTSMDVNGDGKLDLVTANANSNSVSVLFGTGTGTFGAQVTYAVGNSPVSVTSADFNSDGKPDLAVANDSGHSVSVLLGENTDTVTSIAAATSSGSHIKGGDGATFTLSTDAPVVVTGTPLLTLSNNAVATYSGIDADGKPQFTCTVTDGDDTSDLRVTGVALNGGSITAPGETSFAPRQDYSNGSGAWGTTAVDVNGDGKLDVIASDRNDGTLSIFLGNGDGTLQTMHSTDATGIRARYVTSADFNRDGKIDLVTVNEVGVSIFLGNGDGTFQPHVNLATGGVPNVVVTADLNGDGKVDLISANSGGHSVSVLFGNGDGSFQPHQDIAIGSAPHWVATADFNGDGKIDLVISDNNNVAGSIAVFLGNGDGTFQPRLDLVAGSGTSSSVITGDLNGDGHVDIVAANYTTNNVSVLLGNGDGTFQSHQDYASGLDPESVTLADVNGDGKLDIVTTNANDNTLSVLLGNGDGTFQARQDFAAASGPISVTAADLNGDGMTDLVVGGTNSASVSVLLNTSVAPSPFDASSIAAAAGSDTGLVIDTTVPTLAITSDVAQLKIGETATITFTFSEDPGSTFTWDGSTGDVVVTGGTLSAISGSGLVYTATFTPPTATDNGTASITVASATYTDAAGNDGSAGTTPSLHFDTLAPNAPSTPDLSAGSDGGTSSTDNLTNVTMPTFTGTAESGSTVKLYDTDSLTLLGSTVASGGNWSITSSTLSEGAHTIYAQATDGVGNVGFLSSGLAVLIDTTAPTVSITSDVSQLKIGETATITFTFSEDPGSTFTWDGSTGDIAVSGGTLGAISGSGLVRTATFTPTAATDNGTANITVASATYTDAAGNDGSAGTTPSLHFDTLAPSASSTPDLSAGSDSGTSSTDNLTSVTTPTFTGTAESGSTVTLYDTDGVTMLGSAVASGGNWSIMSTALSEGGHTISATATDAAGNVGPSSSGLAVDIDTTASTLSISSDVSQLKIGETATITFTFSEDPGSTFTWDGSTGDIAVSGGTLGAISGSGLVRTATFTPTAATDNGTASITVASATYTDAAGNDGGAGTTPSLHFDTLAPNAPSTPDLSAGSDSGMSSTDNLTSVTTPTFIGTAESGSTVTLYDTDGATVLGSAVASGGNWSITSTALSEGSHTISATAADTAGNVSVASSGLQVQIDTTAPAVTTDSYTTSEDTALTIAAPGVLGNDVDSHALTAAVLSSPTHGSLTLNADGSLTYTPDADYDGADSFSYRATDAAGLSGTANVNLTIAAVNDAPTATNLTQSLTFAEDAAALHLFSQAPVVADIDSASVTATLTLSNAAAGVLVGAGTGVGGIYTITGTPNAVSAALAAVTFDSAQDFNGTASVAVAIDDGHNGPQGSNPSGTVSISVTAVNDAPVNTVPGTLTFSANGDHAITGLSVSDVDATSLTTTLHVDHGILTVGSAAGGATVGGSGTGTVTLTGSVAQIDATLAAANDVHYQGAFGFVGADHLTMTSNDGGGTGAGGVLTDTDVVAINVASTTRPPGFDAGNNGHDDILWYRDNGTVSIWDDGQINNGHFVATGVPLNWHIVGQGDFDGNGQHDILWYRDDGAVSIWDNGRIEGAHVVASPGVVASSWHVAGTGDFDGNGQSDILWRNDDGAAWIWDNGQIGNAHIISGAGVVANSWHIAGTGDFDGNGQSDILWRNDNGAVSIWDNGQINNAHIISAAGDVANSWHIAGTGDFDGNGHSDILWRNDNGAVSIWDNGQINKAHIISAAGVVGNDWHVANTGDYDGNGKTDILWRRDSGAVSIWDNGQIDHAHVIATIPNDWHIV
jgi:hypothetical protein